LIRDKKKFEHFTPNDVLGRLLTFDMQREEANERRRLGELQAKLEGMKIKEVALKANKSSNQGISNKVKGSKQASTSQPKEIKSTPQNDDPSSSSSEDEDDEADYMKIDDMALFMKSYHKGLKKNGYKIVQRRFPNKKKRTCYNCGSTEHFIAKCPYDKKENKYKNKKDNNEGKHEHKKRYKQMGEAHIGHEWDSTKESSEEDVKIATVAIQKSSSTSRLFNNMFDDDDHRSTHVNRKAKSPPPPSDISSSELSDSSDDDTSDVEKYVKLTKKLDSKTKLFIMNLMEELESVKVELADRDDYLEETEKMYIGCKEALELERSEVDSLNKALAKEQREHALTKKANIALNDKYCVLVEKHNKLEKQYNLLCESTPLPSNTNDISISSTSQGCGKCYNLDLKVYSTNLANLEVMKKEIARLNAMLGKRGMEGKKPASGKGEKPTKPQYKDGRNSCIKDGLGHTHGGKTNGRKVINGYECVQFVSKGQEGIDRSTQKVAQG
jgi:hypothetical protein